MLRAFPETSDDIHASEGSAKGASSVVTHDQERVTIASMEPLEEAIQPRLNSGLPGRPSSKELYLAELKRRAVTGEMETTVAAESRHLHKWLLDTHPGQPASGPRAIENSIRVDYQRYKKAPR
jgi:hypothetical protein